ncbi:MAG: hypothetical protein ACRCZ0_09455 [Cetobacterium sp.]
MGIIKSPKGSLVYCDIPYKNTKQYNTSKYFDHTLFYEWVREISKTSMVVISELDAPHDFKEVWATEVSRSANVIIRLQLLKNYLYIRV